VTLPTPQTGSSNDLSAHGPDEYAPTVPTMWCGHVVARRWAEVNSVRPEVGQAAAGQGVAVVFGPSAGSSSTVAVPLNERC
jgi:hypothetical protein